MIFSNITALDKLAFEGRNKAYGSYYLRKRYNRYLAVSIVSGTLFVLLIVTILWLQYFLRPLPVISLDEMYSVEYYTMSPPPDNEPERLAQAFARPPEETIQAPVVADSVVEKENKAVEEQPQEKQEEPEVHTDTAAKPGGSGVGTGIGEDAGLAASVDVIPRFPGGDEARLYFLRKKVRYPEAALKALIQGVVMVVFVVEPDGSVSNVGVDKRIGGGCDEEAIRVTREMPRWEPGKRNGRPVRVMVRMPIVFRIPGKTMSSK
jgi:protein TonB